MCIAGEEELGGSSSGSAGSAGGTGADDGTMPEIVVTAPRLGLNTSLMEVIDWAEVATPDGLLRLAAAGGARSARGSPRAPERSRRRTASTSKICSRSRTT